MTLLPFYFAAIVAVVASLKVVTRTNAIHALLYLVVSLLAVAVCFYLMGAPFAAGLEVIVYAGAILVLFVFAVMMFDMNYDRTDTHSRRKRIPAKFWLGPACLSALLLAELVYMLLTVAPSGETSNLVTAKQVGMLLYGPYLLAVELASFLLLAGLVAAYHIAKPDDNRRLRD